MPTDFERTLRAFVAEGSGLDSNVVIPGNESTPIPTTEYATVLFVDDNADSFTMDTEDTTGYRYWDYITAEYSVQFYRKGAVDRAQTFRSWMWSASGLAYAERNDFVVPERTGIRRLDSIDDDLFEERAQIDLTVTYLYNRSQTPEQIDVVNLDVVDQASEDVTYTFRLTRR